MDNPDLTDHHCCNPHISWTSAMTNHLTENARLSTPPDDAEVRVLESWLRNPWSTAADDVERGPIPDWLYALMQQAADALTRLSHALASETAKRKADTDLLFDAYKGLLVLFRVLGKAGLAAGADTTNALINAIEAKHPEFPARTALRAAHAARRKE